MDSSEFVKLSPQVLADFVKAEQPTDDAPLRNRREPRWPFPGTVELWIPLEGGKERHALATSLNISPHGIGLRCEESIPVDTTLPIAVHLPEATYYGHAQVRHVTPADQEYIIGMLFVFDQ